MNAFHRILLAAFGLVAVSAAEAHCVVGARFFPATLSVDDPCVADELSFPTIASFKNGDDPSTRQLDIAAEFSKRITDRFGISLGTAWTQLSPSGASRVDGFQNLEASFKYQFLTEPARELGDVGRARGRVRSYGQRIRRRRILQRVSRRRSTSARALAACRKTCAWRGRSR